MKSTRFLWMFVCLEILALPARSSNTRSDYETLCKADIFCIGGFGYAGVILPAELACSSLMEKKDIKVLKEVMSHGTHEGRMYALTALYYIDRKIYADVVSPFKKSRQEVQCGNGCVVTWRKMRDIIRNLEKGDYDVISKSKS